MPHRGAGRREHSDACGGLLRSSLSWSKSAKHLLWELRWGREASSRLWIRASTLLH